VVHHLASYRRKFARTCANIEKACPLVIYPWTAHSLSAGEQDFAALRGAGSGRPFRPFCVDRLATRRTCAKTSKYSEVKRRRMEIYLLKAGWSPSKGMKWIVGPKPAAALAVTSWDEGTDQSYRKRVGCSKPGGCCIGHERIVTTNRRRETRTMCVARA
jgi:hypothetical protein